MPRPTDIAKKAARESRSKGGLARAAKLREQRKRAEELVEERMLASLERALDRLDAMLDSEDEQVAIRAVREVLDRGLGKATARHEHGGRVDVVLMEAELQAARTKLDESIERRAKARALQLVKAE
jgi:hypothetical protein